MTAVVSGSFGCWYFVDRQLKNAQEKLPQAIATDQSATCVALAPLTGAVPPGSSMSIRPIRPTPTPSDVNRDGRSPARSRKKIIHSGTAETMRAAIPDGTYLCARERMPIETPRMETPMKAAPRTCCGVTLNARGPLTNSRIVPKTSEAVIKRDPDPMSGGIDFTMSAIPM